MKDTIHELRPLLEEIRDGYRGMRAVRASGPGSRRAGRAARRPQRASRERLRRELASYTTPSDRDDLDATLARHSDDETAEIRRLLDSVPAA